VSPVQLAPQASAHGMPLLLQLAQAGTRAPHEASPPAPWPRPCGLPLTLSAHRHGDFPRSMSRRELLVCELRSRASPAPLHCLKCRHRHEMQDCTLQAILLWPIPYAPDLITFDSTPHFGQTVQCQRLSSSSIREGMRRVSPVQLTPSAGVHGMPVLLRLFSSWET